MKRIKNNIATLSVALAFTLIGAAFVGSAATAYADPLYQATCTISDIPATVTIGSSIKPEITVTNTGLASIEPHMISFVDVAYGPTTYLKEKSVGKVTPGQSKTTKLAKYKFQSGTPGVLAQVFSQSDLNFKGTHVFFQCYQNFSLEQ